MANEVKILISAVDQASKVMGGLKGSFTELNSALGVAEKALQYLDKAFDATVGQFTKYADQVEDLGRNTGMTAEETSQLIQVADDLFIEFGSLTQAAKALKEKGLSPTIDTLAKLSEQYLAIEDPVKRAQFANENFGRSYQEMTKILEAGGETLRNMGKDIPKGLILSEADLRAAKEYKKSLDDLNDTFKGIAVSVGKEVVPVLADTLNWLQKLAAGKLRIKLGTGIVDPAEFAKARAELAAVSVAITGLGTELIITTKEIWQHSYSLDEITRLYALSQEGAGNYTSSLAMAYDAQMDMNQANLDAADASGEAARAQEIENQKLADAQQKANDAATEIGVNLAAAYDNLKTAQQNWLTDVGSAALAAMGNIGWLSKGQQAEIKGAIDAVTGSTYVATDQMNADLAAAMLKFKETGDPEQLKTDIQAVADKFEEDLAPQIKAAKDEIIKLQTEMDKLADRHIAVYVDVMYPNGPLPDANNSGGGIPDTTPTPQPKRPPLPIPKYSPDFVGGGTIINIYPATQSAAAAAMNAVIAMSKNQRINTRMSAG